VPQRKWTQSQGQAVRFQGKSLLVSAAAGSGKTTVLADRCVHLVCDAPGPEHERCEVDQLLVVTFTEDAAAEMRGRIQDALTRRIGEEAAPTKWLLRQLALVEHAQISTIHSFCARLLREHFSLAGIDPRFVVMDADEAMLLRIETARELFADRYERDGGVEFRDFLDTYAGGDAERLVDRVCRAHDLLCSLESPDEWLRQAIGRVEEAGEKPLKKSQAGQELLRLVDASLAALARNCAATLERLRAMIGFAAYVERLAEWSATVGTWRKIVARDGFDALAEAVGSFEPDRLPPVGPDVPNRDFAKGLVDSIKSQMRKGDLDEWTQFNEAEWRDGQRTTAPSAKYFAGLVEEFSGRYGEAKALQRGVDFSDLERKALDILRQRGEEGGWEPSPVARECHRRYRHVLVDEYQDVNGLQDAILRLVSTECVAGEGAYEPNLFAVGDVKQSIYRFRLADPKRFLQREADFRDVKNTLGATIDLQENFRSREPLLEAVNEVFRRVMTREAAEIEYGKSHELRAPAELRFPAPDGKPRFAGAPIELHVLSASTAEEDEESDDVEPSEWERAEYEAALCARRILCLTGKDGSDPVWIGDRPADFGDVAILFRSLRGRADDFARILRAHGIAVHYSGGAGFFDATEVRDMVALLSLLDNQQQDIAMAAFLRSPMARLWEIGGADEALARIRLAYPAKVAEDSAEGGGATEGITFHQAVARYAADHADELGKRLAELLAQLSRWRDAARQRTLAELVWTIYDETGYLTYVAGLENGEQRTANLLQFHERARQFGSFLKQGLHRFMSFLQRLREETDLSLPSISDENQRAVRLMTIHKSKGLEFPIVIVPDLGKRHNLADAGGDILLERESGLGLKVVDRQRLIRYPSLSWLLASESVRRQSLAEELRLLYVAMTRAKEHLILVGTSADKSLDQWAGKFAGRSGAFSTEEILGANSMLDWLGPAQAACGSGVLELTVHSSDEMKAWPAAANALVAASDARADLAELKPLSPPPAADAKAAEIIARLELEYPRQAMTTLAATIAATAVAEEREIDDYGDEWTAPPLETEVELPVLTSASGAARPPLSPAQVGEATHRVLEHLDYLRACDAADIESQIAKLAERRLLDDAEATCVDRDAIAWFVATDLGQRLKANAAGLLREIPFALAARTDSDDPMDAVMIRGRIDLIVPDGAGVAVVDYKTDRLRSHEVEARAREYATQIGIYRQALQRIGGFKVSGVYLVFLYPRVIWTDGG
jgi:ATP-dependent helicase/nuclease subunit A